MKNKDFDCSRFVTLLEKERLFHQKSVFLPSKESSELRRYQITLENVILYESRFQYYNLIQSYQTNEMDLGSFACQIFALERKDRKRLKSLEIEILENLDNNKNELSNLVIPPDSRRFGELIDDLSAHCEVVNEIITESKFRSLIEDIFFEMEEMLNVKTNDILSYDELIDRSFTILKTFSLTFIGILILSYFY